jgi:hypothetical protein
MLAGQHKRVAALAWSIGMLGSLDACSDVSSPAHTRAINSSFSAKAVTVDSTPGLVAAYGFDEVSGSSVGDASMFANNGTFGTGVWRTTGRFGGALFFNGSGRVTIPSTESLSLTNAMTLEAWVNPSVVDASWRDVVYKGNDNYYLMATSSQGGVPAGGASFGNISATTEAYAPSALATNTWTHLAVTYDGSIIRLYVNGAQVATRSKTGMYTTSNNPLQIGGNTFYWQYFRGKIDEVRVYNRALGAAQIQRDMNTAVTAVPPADTAAPVVSIVTPTSDSVFNTTADAVAVSGTATDNVSVIGVSWSNDRGGSGVASGTTNWSVQSIPLQPGTNTITVSAQDEANNVATKTLAVVRDGVPAGDTSSVHTYTTNFAAVESPISEGGRWINGRTNGLDWSDVWSTGGKGIGRQTGASYTDATALLTGTWGANQQVTATVFTSATVSDACYPEVELRLRSTISARVNRGYEVSFKVSQSGSAYLIIVRWNGPFADFSYLLNTSGAQYGVKNGDVISAKVVGNVITVYKNGVVMGSASDNTYANGAPGMGFNLENAPAGCSGSNDKYGYTQFSATDGVR